MESKEQPQDRQVVVVTTLTEAEEQAEAEYAFDMWAKE